MNFVGQTIAKVLFDSINEHKWLVDFLRTYVSLKNIFYDWNERCTHTQEWHNVSINVY